jgi:hypothetical protein
VAQVVSQDRAVGNIAADRKVALIIGNTNYDPGIGRLKNPVNDANDMADALKRLGFTLVGGKAQLDVNKKEMLKLIREFSAQIKLGGVGFFYFSGHGVQVNKRNYIIPITDSLVYEDDAESEAVEVDDIAREMKFSENRLNILVLDACRNNNLLKRGKESKHGLAEPNLKPRGTFIAFAADDGQVALDNSDRRNGLYTQELLKNLERPNVRLDDIFRATANSVIQLSGGQQEPNFFDKDGNGAQRQQPAQTPVETVNIPPSSTTKPHSNVVTVPVTVNVTTISHGPNLSKDSYYEKNGGRLRFLALLLDESSKSYIDKRVDDLVKKKDTHQWDDRWYYMDIENPDRGLLLLWYLREGSDTTYGWLFVRLDESNVWSYTADGFNWTTLDRGVESEHTWGTNYFKITIKTPIISETWRANEIQYRFGH